MNKRAFRVAILLVLGYIFAYEGICQNAVIEESRIRSTQTLSGRVQFGPVSSGLKDVLIEVCDSQWKNPTARTTTNGDGDFSFPKLSQQKLYYLKISMPGANTLLLKVRLSPIAAKKKLTIKLIAAT